MDNRNNNQNPEQQSLNNINRASQPLKRQGLKAAQAVAKKTGKILMNALAGVAKAFLPYILIGGLCLLVAWFGFNLIFEWRGAELNHYAREDNPVVLNDEGYYVANSDTMTDKNKIIRDFYEYFGGTSVWKLKPGSNDQFLDRNSKEYANLVDYYNRENIFALNNHMLLILDDFLYNDEIRNPEQFIKPIYFDKDTLSLKPLTNNEGEVIAVSKEINLETGVETGNTISSVRDHGLASILTYNSNGPYTKTLMIRGEYSTIDKWDEATKSVIQVPYNEKIEDVVITGYPQNINLIDKVITFAGEVEYVYEYKEEEIGGLSAGRTNNPNTPYKSVYYGTYTELVNCRTEIILNLETGEEEEIDKCDEIYHPLYKHRSENTKIIEKLPVETGINTTEDTNNYFHDYIVNFESYVHVDALDDETLFKRINYDSFVFDKDISFENNGIIEVGTKLDSRYQGALSLYNRITKHSKEFGVDENIIVAIIAQESGGSLSANNGVANLRFENGELYKEATARNINGELIGISIRPDQVKDVDLSIRYIVIRYAEFFQKYRDHLKALQGYNFGEEAMNKVRDINQEAWNTSYGWLGYLEEGRVSIYPNTRSATISCLSSNNYNTSQISIKDSCYLYNVLRYYNGREIEEERTPGQKIVGFFTSLIKDIFPINESKRVGEHREYIPLIHESVPEDILRMTTSFNNQTLFSDESVEVMNFYNFGFFTSINSIFQTYDDVVNLTPGGRGFIWPAPVGREYVSSKYGYRIHPTLKEKRFHTGIDIPLATGQSVYAVADGEVIESRAMGTYGYTVMLSHGNGVQTLYAHNSRLLVKKGDIVKQGDVIALAGSTGRSTGPHIHFEVRVNGVHVDPMPWVKNN